MDRKFQTGDQIYGIHDVQKFGLSPDRIYTVLGIYEDTYGPSILLNENGPRIYEKGFALYIPAPPTDAGAEEYEEIMALQEATTK